MDVDRWERVKELFDQALQRDAAERAYFLIQACPDDPKLRREVESLLSGDQKAGGFLQDPVAHIPFDTTGTDAPPSTFSPGQTISGRFNVLRFIGRGGMGEVYEAQDLELRERVALKTIRPEIAYDGRILARFKQEIQLARRVTHPNVCRMYDIGQYQPEGSDGASISFLTMELLEGETLAAWLKRRGRMSSAEALPLIRQMAEGLAAAHRKEVIHRDFKPGNVMLVPEPAGATGRVPPDQTTQSAPPVPAEHGAVPAQSLGTLRAVITDFGLAKASEAAASTHDGASSTTTARHIIGTPAYMAPEQLESRPVTPATDVYALGLVTYEILAGRPPFMGDPSNRLREPSPSPRAEVAGLDPRLEQVIRRCLERNPSARFSSATEVLAALTDRASPAPPRKNWIRHAVAAGIAAVFLAGALVAVTPQMREAITAYLFPPSIPNRKNLVVLPFRAEGGSPEEQARCKGFTDTVTAKLTQAPGIEVAPADSVRESHVDSIQKARTQFGANLVFSASWEQAGTSVRINLILIEVDGKREKQLRTETVTKAAVDVFGLQDQVVLTALRMLGVEPSSKVEQGLTAHGTDVPSAYDYYVQAIGYLQNYERVESLDSAITLFLRAIEQDKDFARAQAMLALACWYKYQATKDPKWTEKAKESAISAQESNSGLPEVQLAVGDFYSRTGAYSQAVSAFHKALEVDPDSVEAYDGLGHAYNSLGLTSDAERAFRRAIDLRSSNWNGYNSLGEFLYNQARYDEAAQAWQKVIDLAPDNPWGYLNVGDAYLSRGEFQKAGDFFHKASEVDPSNADAYSNLGTVSFYLRRYDEAARLCQKAISLRPRQFDYWGNLGDAYRMIPAASMNAAEQYRQAIELARAQLAVNPKSATVLSLLGLYLARVGQARQARESLDEALALSPSDPNVLYIACLVRLVSGAQQDGLRWLARAVRAGYPRGLLAADPELDVVRKSRDFPTSH